MKTKVVLDTTEAVILLKKGEPIVMPTETVYGLAAPLYQPSAIEKVFAIKGRPRDNPLIVHIAKKGELRELVSSLPDHWERLAEAFWPGPLTLVFPKSERVPSAVSAGHPTVAVRMPSHPIARRLIEEVGEPLVAPSANLSGRPSPTCVRDVLEDLEGRVALIIDGGESSVGIESTVLSLCGPRPVLLRPGNISQQSLEEVLGVEIFIASKETPVHSPGMKYRHYAPRAEIRFVNHPDQLTSSFILSSVPILGIQTRPLREQSLYAELREADRLNIGVIDVFGLGETSAGLRDRLVRAASK